MSQKMPGTVSVNGDSHQLMKCARCQSSDETYVIRTERLCKNCLKKYVTTKVLKRLETGKLRGGFKEPEKKILVPISFGVSSICLLSLLDSHLKNRREQGRHAGYNLHLLHVDQSSVVGDSIHQKFLDGVRHRFPFLPFSIVPLEACFDYGVSIDVPLDRNLDTVFERSLDHLRRLKSILVAASSLTSKIDLVGIIRRRLIVSFALRAGCHCILYGDTATRLAERVLAETAKGRGEYLPWLTTEGMNDDGVYCSYPMRDLLKKELSIYASIIAPALTSVISGGGLVSYVGSSRGTTIDSLMRQYFESVEKDYPSIITNVVRTTSRLLSSPTDEHAQSCAACGLRIVDRGWGGEQEEVNVSNATEAMVVQRLKFLCYGCSRSLEII